VTVLDYGFFSHMHLRKANIVVIKYMIWQVIFQSGRLYGQAHEADSKVIECNVGRALSVWQSRMVVEW